MLGLDYSFSRPNLDTAWNQGYRFVIRYLSWLPNPKCITPAERDVLLAKGFDIALNWEYDAQDALGGGQSGRVHAQEAIRQARNLGYPSGSTIYFSVDFNVQPGQLYSVRAYLFAALTECHDAGYRMGVYGGRLVVGDAFSRGLVDDGWQTRGWSGTPTQWVAMAAVQQYAFGVTVGGASVDLNTTVGAPVYFWNHKTAPTPAPQPRGHDMLSAFMRVGSPAVYITDGWRYRLVPDYPAFLNLIDSGLLFKPAANSKSLLDQTGWAVVLGEGESLEGFGGVRV